jgi:hypothetical protein
VTTNRHNGGQGLAMLAMLASLAALILVLLVSQAGVGNNARRAAEGQQAHGALCALKDDIRRRITNSQQLLEDYPAGLPGIPASIIEQSISNQQQTLDALETLECEGGPP